MATGKMYLALGGAVAAITTYKHLNDWNNSHTSHLEPDRRGSIGRRVFETAQAHLVQKRIKDPKTAMGHIKLVSTLSSQGHADRTPLGTPDEIQKIQDAYDTTYFPAAVETTEDGGYAIFSEIKEMGEKSCYYSGSTSNLFDPWTRRSILSGEYYLCKGTLTKENRREVQVIVTGGKSDSERCKKCAFIAEQYARGLLEIDYWNHREGLPD